MGNFCAVKWFGYSSITRHQVTSSNRRPLRSRLALVATGRCWSATHSVLSGGRGPGPGGMGVDYLA